MMYDNIQKAGTAKRLKQCRESRGLSHTRLAQALRAEYGIKISDAVLKNYEIAEEHHTKFAAGFGMNIQYLYTLADFYGVSSDYLLGKTDKKTPSIEVRAICEYTGLSLEAIARLRSDKERFEAKSDEPEARFHTQVISELIISNKWHRLISVICGYVESCFEYERINRSEPPMLDAFQDKFYQGRYDWLRQKSGATFAPRAIETEEQKRKALEHLENDRLPERVWQAGLYVSQIMAELRSRFLRNTADNGSGGDTHA